MKNILLLEDVSWPTYCDDSIIACLIRAGYEVLVETNPPPRKTPFQNPEVAFDLALINFDNYNHALRMVRKIRSAGNTSPIIVVSYHTHGPLQYDKALEAGADNFVPKTYGPRALIDMIENTINYHTHASNNENEALLVSNRI